MVATNTLLATTVILLDCVTTSNYVVWHLNQILR